MSFCNFVEFFETTLQSALTVKRYNGHATCTQAHTTWGLLNLTWFLSSVFQFFTYCPCPSRFEAKLIFSTSVEVNFPPSRLKSTWRRSKSKSSQNGYRTGRVDPHTSRCHPRGSTSLTYFMVLL